MASKSKSIKESKRRRTRDYQQVPQTRDLSGRAETAKVKLSKTQEHKDLRPSDLSRFALDYTDKDRLKVWFETPQDGATNAGRHRIPVKLFLARPQREDRVHTFSGSVAEPDSIELHFERFCSYGINAEAALQVGDQYLKWTRDSLVIPRGMTIRDDSHGAQPLSLGDEPPIELGETNKLDELLELVAQYNGTHYYHAISRNSKVFVRDALQKLGKDVHPLLQMFDNYQQQIKRSQTLGIRDDFRTHEELDAYYKQADHTAIVKSKRNVEYLYFLCVCFHVQMGKARGGRTTACEEQDCCLPYFKSNLTRENLIVKEFWQIFTD